MRKQLVENMITMQDVAKASGVSTATVSNYLNNKKHLTQETAVKIAAAIKELNYFVQSSGRDLRIGSNRDIGIIFPNISEPYFEKIISSIKGCLTQNGKNFVLELTDNYPQFETKALHNFIGKNVSGIILYTCQPDNEMIFESLGKSKIPYVLIDRKAESLSCNFISTNYKSLFYNLSNDLIALGHKKIALVCGPNEFTENINAFNGFLKVIDENNMSELRKNVIFTFPSRENGFRAGMKLLESRDNLPTAIMTTSYRIAEGLRYALLINHMDPNKNIQIVSTGDSIDDVFYFDSSITKTLCSAYKIGETAVSVLLKNIKTPLLFDCQETIFNELYDKAILKPAANIIQIDPINKPPNLNLKAKQEICVLLLDDDASIYGLQQLMVDFYAKENISVKIEKVLPQNAFDYIIRNISAQNDKIDIFMFDIPWLKYLVQSNYLLCIDEYIKRENINSLQFVPTILDNFSKVGNHFYALPYMACSQLLFYRKDLFTNKNLCSKFEEEYMIPLTVPTSWLHFNAISKFFSQEYNPSSPTKYGHAMSISRPEQFMCDLMPRIWSYKDDFCNTKGKINLNTTPILKAVCGMLTSVSISEPSLFTNSPTDTINSFISEDVAMVYTFYNYATGIVDRFKSKVANKFGYASIPGNCPTLAGWSLGISKYSKNQEMAFKFLKWASSNDIAIAHTILGGQSPHMAVYQNYDLVTLYPWLPKAVNQFEKCQQRKTPKDSSGKYLNERHAEEIVFNNLLPLMQEAALGNIASIDKTKTVLMQTQNELERLL